MKVHTHSCLELPLECNEDQMPLTNKVCSGLFNHLGSNKNICSFTLVLEGNASKEIPES